jgi:hypothetical protein
MFYGAGGGGVGSAAPIVRISINDAFDTKLWLLGLMGGSGYFQCYVYEVGHEVTYPNGNRCNLTDVDVNWGKLWLGWVKGALQPNGNREMEVERNRLVFFTRMGKWLWKDMDTYHVVEGAATDIPRNVPCLVTEVDDTSPLNPGRCETSRPWHNKHWSPELVTSCMGSPVEQLMKHNPIFIFLVFLGRSPATVFLSRMDSCPKTFCLRL